MEESGEVELPLDGVGTRLLRAREAAGLSRTQLAAQTKIPERHLIAIELGRFQDLPASTYAVGFSRSFARAVGLDEQEVATAVRAEMSEYEPETERRQSLPSFEPSDPARVPSARFAWISALAGLAIILAGLGWWGGYFAPGGELPSILPSPTEAASAAAPAPSAAPSGQVVFTALEPLVWVKFSDGEGNQLFQKELSQGESYAVPVEQAVVTLTTARPQALAITIGGQPVAKLSEEQKTLRSVSVTAAGLLARGTETAPQVTQSANSTPTPQRTVSAQRTPAPRQTTAARPSAAPQASSAAAVVATPEPAPVATPVTTTADR